MFENVREDIRVGVQWHSVPGVRRRWGEGAERVAAVLLAHSMQVVLLYRLQAWARARRIPLLPNLCRRATTVMASVTIGDQVTVGPGLLIAHGNVVIDGWTTLGALCQVSPFVTIGLDTGGPDANFAGPSIGRFVFIGTGAKILGAHTIGDNARIGANAVVMCDVPANSTAVGVPARIIPHETSLGPVVPSERAQG